MAPPDAEPTDAQLVERSLAGERAAFGLLVERHRAGVERLLHAMFGNLVGVEDLVQDSFLQAYLDLERLRDQSRFGAWVRGIAINLARMELRSGRLLFVSWEALRSASRSPHASPESLAERRELLRRIRQAIEALPPAERQAIEQVYLRELSHREAAQQLNTSVGAIKVRVHRGRQRLHQELLVEFPAAAGEEETEMIAVTVRDVVAKLAEDEVVPQVEFTKPAVEQADAILMRLKLHRVIILAEKEGVRLLPIWVGPAEGEAIVIHLDGRTLGRPITFDLMKELMLVANLHLDSVTVSRIHETVFFGTLNVTTSDGDAREIDCRPSDAVNLALRMATPIYVAPEVMDQHGVVPQVEGNYDYLPAENGEQWVSLLQG